MNVLLGMAIIGASVIAGMPGSAAEVRTMELLDGTCGKESHTAEGPIGSDLTKRQSRFYCSAVAIVTFNDGHILLNFVEKASNTNPQLGFAGWPASGGVLNVNHLYFIGSKEPASVTDSGCKFFYKGERLTGIFCGAHLDEGVRRTTVAVVFTVAATSRSGAH